MKKILFLLTAVLTLVACGNKDNDINGNTGSGKKGKLVLNAQAEDSFIVKTKAETKAEAQPAIADFKVVIKNSDGTVWKQWEKYGEGITVDEIPAGNYTIETSYGENFAAAWDAPYFFASKGFSINADATTEVALSATLNNSKISLSYDEKVLSDLENIEVVVTGKVDGILTFTPAETRAAYFAVPENGVIKITVTGTRKSNGEALQQTTEITGYAAAQWHKIKIVLKSTAGSGNVSLTIDQTLIEKEQDIEIPDQDDITGGGDQPNPDPDPEPEPDVNVPSITGASYNGTPFNIDNALSVSAANVSELDVLIAAENGIEKLLVKIDSPTIPQEDLTNMGLGGVFDMVTPGAAEEGLTELGLYDPASPIKGKKAHTFSVGSFMAMLAGVGGVGQTHTFEIEVIDAQGKSIKKSLVINLAE